ncbi:MAG TPA: DUF1622 domain-containing protein [Thermoanaerobaculia bacterium]
MIAAVDWLRLGVEAFGAIVIAVGLVAAAVTFVRRLGSSAAGTHQSRLQGTRRILAHYLAVALEFQLAADILATAVAPSWNQIGSWPPSRRSAPRSITSSRARWLRTSPETWYTIHLAPALLPALP